jgi:NADPH:quinone reductase-like Zn-dependent oxidoreductase
VAVTAWQALFDHAHIKEGQTLVIHGAAGNVGAYAVQLARRAGVRTIDFDGVPSQISILRKATASKPRSFWSTSQASIWRRSLASSMVDN